MRKSITELKEDIVFTERIDGREFVFHSTWGLFSPGRIDDGSRLLLEYADLPENAKVLDVGCGYGALGIPLAARVPRGSVHMVDKDFVAVEYAKRNAKLNGVGNCEVYLSNLCAQVDPALRFDAIVTNVPAKGERELYDILLDEARARLAPGGRIYLVSISGLKEFFKKNLKETFGNYKKLKQSGTYTVASAALAGTP